MMMLAGAAMSALDTLFSLVSAKSTTSAGAPNTAATPTFNLDSSTTAATTGTGAAAGSNVPFLSHGTLNALLSLQGQQGTSTDLAARLFSRLDTDQSGTISKSEFEAGLGKEVSASRADAVFAKLDSDGDGSVSQSELSSALKHHGHHHHAPSDTASSGNDGSNAASSIGGTSSRSTTNADGSTTTTISYADGSQVTMTRPSTSSGTSAGNLLERLIARQAQMLSATTPGSGMAMSV